MINRTLPSDQEASGRTLGEEEIAAVTRALRSGTLTSTKGEFVKQLETGFADLIGVNHALACASGSAAVHTAVAAIDPEPGDEIITTAITDMGAIAPILCQGAIPVFADVDPSTYNLTPETIEARISERTRAIIVTHLFGNPCDMEPIMALATKHGIKVIEDCAQAFLASCNGKIVGSIGDIGCFSLQQGKHITTGEGGLLTTNDPELARRMLLYVNKAWGYGDPKPDHYFLALNYRLTELQGAVGVAQLAKLSEVVMKRQIAANSLTQLLSDAKGIALPTVAPGCTHVYWKYCLQVEGENVPETTIRLGSLLRDRGVACAPRYIQKPAFHCELFTAQRTFGKSRYPFTLARPDAIDYRAGRFPGTFEALARVLVLPWNEKYTTEDTEFIASVVQDALASQ